MTSMLIRPRKPGHCCRVFVPKRGGCRVTRALLAAFALAWRPGSLPRDADGKPVRLVIRAMLRSQPPPSANTGATIRSRAAS
ncbi:MAG TPA: hypothetical protein VF940_34120 [Streptosporangiaceae bacterium]